MNYSFFNDFIVTVARKASHTTVVTATITMIYVLDMAQLVIDWQLAKFIFVDDGETRKDKYFTIASVPVWESNARGICKC